MVWVRLLRPQMYSLAQVSTSIPVFVQLGRFDSELLPILEVLLRASFFSIEPYIRGHRISHRLRHTSVPAYVQYFVEGATNWSPPPGSLFDCQQKALQAGQKVARAPIQMAVALQVIPGPKIAVTPKPAQTRATSLPAYALAYKKCSPAPIAAESVPKVPEVDLLPIKGLLRSPRVRGCTGY